VTGPDKDAYTKIVNAVNSADPGDPESVGGWHIVDFAASVKQHPDWWGSSRPTSAGLKNLAQTLTSQIRPATTGSSADPGSASGIPSPRPPTGLIFGLGTAGGVKFGAG
jgi:hypothetical protein